jgi:hypothetical protein
MKYVSPLVLVAIAIAGFSTKRLPHDFALEGISVDLFSTKAAKNRLLKVELIL